MVDLETLGTSESAVILSIGAVKFDPMWREGASRILDGFHVAVDPASAQQSGGTIDANTVSWWMHHERAAARNSLQEMSKQDLFSALDGLAMWMNTDTIAGVWGNAPSFDCSILRHSFTRVGLDAPWKFWQDRCYRTLSVIGRDVPKPCEGIAHTALADATNQALHVQAIVSRLGLTI